MLELPFIEVEKTAEHGSRPGWGGNCQCHTHKTSQGRGRDLTDPTGKSTLLDFDILSVT